MNYKLDLISRVSYYFKTPVRRTRVPYRTVSLNRVERGDGLMSDVNGVPCDGPCGHVYVAVSPTAVPVRGQHDIHMH